MTAALLDGDSFSVLTRAVRFSFCLKGIVQMFDIRCFLTSYTHARGGSAYRSFDSLSNTDQQYFKQVTALMSENVSLCKRHGS